ncbi:uncharacterized protein LOC102360955 isoform X2 [Latimeria chalumnae]|uniref:uncharacterized protein LOC102360955 isoform X2 n=1 Tax=Latimeria chalumnae TaxID=7897 RepID=UPI0003C172E1|nr:PREDICTED: uncharacterized protein LOC102360955 isoform X2 [Latimeria chalumnae]|eukprot:XP_006007716.1 PREDICTED: uncharacterized protein LOC102360955 isoform X2 [Latimeria chalumnae]
MHKRTADGRFLENVNWLEASLLLFSSLSSCTAQVHIAAKIGDKVILPCTFTCSIKDLSDLTIVWESSSKPVHTYHENEDHTEHQSAEFKGRTCLFYNELEHGNASLLLKNVTEADNRVYTCTVDFMKEVKHQNVLVTVGSEASAQFLPITGTPEIDREQNKRGRLVLWCTSISCVFMIIAFFFFTLKYKEVRQQEAKKYQLPNCYFF